MQLADAVANRFRITSEAGREPHDTLGNARLGADICEPVKPCGESLSLANLNHV